VNPRPKEVMIGVAVLGLVYAYRLYYAIARGWLTADPAAVISSGTLAQLMGPLLILGIWFGLGVARMACAALFIDRLFTIFISVSLAPIGVRVVSYLLMAAEAVGLILLFLPASNTWFRAWKEKLKRHRFYPYWLAIGIVFGIPLVLLLLVSQSAHSGGGPLNLAAFIGLLFVVHIPSMIFAGFGSPDFKISNMGAGPSDATGLVLLFVFYVLIAWALGAALRRRRKKEQVDEPAP
jgi:hypothetical protein